MRNRIEILLVEDSPADVRLTEEELKDSGLEYSLNVAWDGEQAMEFLHKCQNSKTPFPDVILLDLNMPKKNGHEVLKEISQDKELANIPIVLLTVSQNDQDVLEALRLKMNYYINKPVSAEKLRVLLSAIFELMSEEQSIVEGHESINEDTHVRLILAGNPHTPSFVLAKLAQEANPKIRSHVAENPRTPQDVLTSLANDTDPSVRISVLYNPKVPQQLMERLALDTQDDVRLALAENPKTPADILKRLTGDDNVFVASAASDTIASDAKL